MDCSGWIPCTYRKLLYRTQRCANKDRQRHERPHSSFLQGPVLFPLPDPSSQQASKPALCFGALLGGGGRGTEGGRGVSEGCEGGASVESPV